MELIACVDGLTTGPRPDWTPDEDDSNVPDTSVDAEWESRVM